MSFSRNFLKSIGLTDDQISSVMEEHTAVTDALKKDRDAYKAEAEKVPGLQRELETHKGGEDFKAKYESEHQAFETYKADIAKKAQLEKVQAAYRKLLLDEKISEKRLDGIIRLTDFDKIKLDKDGNLEDVATLKDNIGKEWGEFRVSTKEKDHKPDTPPDKDNGDAGTTGIRQMTAKWHAAKYGETPTNS